VSNITPLTQSRIDIVIRNSWPAHQNTGGHPKLLQLETLLALCSLQGGPENRHSFCWTP